MATVGLLVPVLGAEGRMESRARVGVVATAPGNTGEAGATSLEYFFVTP